MHKPRRLLLSALVVALAGLGSSMAAAAGPGAPHPVAAPSALVKAAVPARPAAVTTTPGQAVAKAPAKTVGTAARAGHQKLVARGVARAVRTTRRIELPTSKPVAPAKPTSPYVTACGIELCLAGEVFPLKMASVLGIDSHRAATIAAARQGGLNTIRLVNMLNETGPLSGAYDPARWHNVDADIAAAQAAGLHVELDLSSYRNLLFNHGINPYAQDWKPFLTFVANRVNTVTGVRYAHDPTIALVAFAGEVQPPKYGGNTVHATAPQILGFFTRTFAEWHALDAHHLRTTGGQLFVADPYAGISWKTLALLPGDDVCSNHVYSHTDLTVGMANLASWCGGKRPWIVEEYGANESVGDAARAQFFQAVSARARLLDAAGVGFWNLGPQLLPGSHDVNPSLPLTWSAAQAQA